MLTWFFGYLDEPALAVFQQKYSEIPHPTTYVMTSLGILSSDCVTLYGFIGLQIEIFGVTLEVPIVPRSNL